MTPVYAGTFDPITRGHLSVVKRMVKMFNNGIVLVAVNPDKVPLFDPKDRARLIFRALKDEGITNVGVGYTTEYVVDWTIHLYDDALLVRGIRNATETDYELKIAEFNRNRKVDWRDGLETIFVPAATGMEDISSSAVRHLAETASREELLKYVTPSVADALIERVQKGV